MLKSCTIKLFDRSKANTSPILPPPQHLLLLNEERNRESFVTCAFLHPKRIIRKTDEGFCVSCLGHLPGTTVRERWGALPGLRRSLCVCFLSRTMKTGLGRAPLLLQQNGVCCGAMRTKYLLGAMYFHFLSCFPSYCKVVVWIDGLQR